MVAQIGLYQRAMGNGDEQGLILSNLAQFFPILSDPLGREMPGFEELLERISRQVALGKPIRIPAGEREGNATKGAYDEALRQIADFHGRMPGIMDAAVGWALDKFSPGSMEQITTLKPSCPIIALQGYADKTLERLLESASAQVRPLPDSERQMAERNLDYVNPCVMCSMLGVQDCKFGGLDALLSYVPPGTKKQFAKVNELRRRAQYHKRVAKSFEAISAHLDKGLVANASIYNTDAQQSFYAESMRLISTMMEAPSDAVWIYGRVKRTVPLRIATNIIYAAAKARGDIPDDETLKRLFTGEDLEAVQKNYCDVRRNAERKLYDLFGITVVGRDDEAVQRILAQIEQEPGVEVARRKDYDRKDTGYRAFHRTLVSDRWGGHEVDVHVSSVRRTWDDNWSVEWGSHGGVKGAAALVLRAINNPPKELAEHLETHAPGVQRSDKYRPLKVLELLNYLWAGNKQEITYPVPTSRY